MSAQIMSDHSDVERHLHAFVHLALHHGTHDPCRQAHDLRLVSRDRKLEVLYKVRSDCLHLDQPVSGIALSVTDNEVENDLRKSPAIQSRVSINNVEPWREHTRYNRVHQPLNNIQARSRRDTSSTLTERHPEMETSV